MTDSLSLGPLLIGFEGTRVDQPLRERLLHPVVGGVVLFTRNFGNRQQLAELCEELHDLRDPPLLITVDQEGGRVQRFRSDMTRLPPLAALLDHARGDLDHATDLCYRHARVMAGELLPLGVDLSFTPVLDLRGPSTVIGNRALAPTAEQVIHLGRAYLAGMKDAGMPAVGKHFPGHGSIAPDTHFEDAEDPRSLEEIWNSDLKPFVALADDLAGLMIAHVVYSSVDDRPAGHSPVWLQDILRDRIGYDGTVISDDLAMHAAKVVGDPLQRLIQALDAGCDIALQCQPDDVDELFAALPDQGEWPDAGSAINRLRGHSPMSADDMNRVAEWRHWQASMQSIAERVS